MSRSAVMLVLPSRLASVGELEEFVADIIVDNGLNSDFQGNLLVTLTEAVTNAICHGNNLDDSKHVRVEVERKPSKLKVTVTDEGPGFQPKSIPDPTSPEFLSQEGGRGVFIMRALSDEIKFCKHGRSVEMCYEIDCGQSEVQHSYNAVHAVA